MTAPHKPGSSPPTLRQLLAEALAGARGTLGGIDLDQYRRERGQ